MSRKLLMALAVCALLAVPAFAQERVELSGSVGWTFSDGVSFSNATPINGSVYNRADPADSVNFGFTFGFYLNPQAEVEFLFNRQKTTLDVTGAGPKLSGDMNIDSYHANFVYNMGESESAVRPFIFIGLGASTFGDAVFTGRTVPGNSRFSWAFGAGVKGWASRNVGFKGQFRWVPTYIKTDGYGWWCDPFWGCAPVGNTQYANQVEFSGGIVARF